MTVRQVFYLLAKSELGYGRVQTGLTILRRRGTMRPEVNNLSLSSHKTTLLINSPATYQVSLAAPIKPKSRTQMRNDRPGNLICGHHDGLFPGSAVVRSKYSATLSPGTLVKFTARQYARSFTTFGF